MAKEISLLNFHHSSLITHYSIFHTRLASSPNFHYSIFFTLFVGSYLSAGAVFLFFFFSFFFCFCFQYPNSPKLKKKNQTANLGKEKKVKKWSKIAAVGPLCVFNYNIVIELWVMETENSQNMFSVFITHNSKIRELNDGSRVMETGLSFAK